MKGYRIVFYWRREKSEFIEVGADLFPTLKDAAEQLVLTEDFGFLETRHGIDADFSVALRPEEVVWDEVLADG